MPAPQGAGGDFYALFGLEERYDLDLAELESRYLTRSKDVHPDRFVNSPASLRVQALQQSMQLNDAYKTLKRPLPRAEYLLGRHGVSISANETLSPVFLMEILELREELQEAKHAGNMAELGRLEEAMLDRHDAALDALTAGFADFGKSGDHELLASLKQQVILLRYIARYLEEFQDVDDDASD